MRDSEDTPGTEERSKKSYNQQLPQAGFVSNLLCSLVLTNSYATELIYYTRHFPLGHLGDILNRD